MEIEMPMYMGAENKPLQDFLRCHLLIDDWRRLERPFVPKNFLLLFCLILLFSSTLCDARCYFRPASKYGCLSNRNLYVFGAVWKTEDCYQCRCKMNAMICCSLVLIPKNYDKVNCVGLFHKKSCSIRVVKKTNPDISCKIYNGIG